MNRSSQEQWNQKKRAELEDMAYEIEVGVVRLPVIFWKNVELVRALQSLQNRADLFKLPHPRVCEDLSREIDNRIVLITALQQQENGGPCLFSAIVRSLCDGFLSYSDFVRPIVDHLVWEGRLQRDPSDRYFTASSAPTITNQSR